MSILILLIDMKIRRNDKTIKDFEHITTCNMRSNKIIYFFLCSSILICCLKKAKQFDDMGARQQSDSVYLEQLLQREKVGIKKLKIYSDTLQSVSIGTFIWRPLSITEDIDSLQLINKNIFNVIEKRENDKFYTYLLFDKSFIKLRQSKMDSNFEIDSAKIQNRQIKLTLGIHIGMKKKDFFSKLFNEDADNVFFSRINVFQNFDPLGETLGESFVFKGDSLSYVILKPN